MAKQNQIEEIRDNLKSIWLHRKGNEVRAAVQDVIDAKYKEPYKPLIISCNKKDDTWTLTIFLPPGIAFLEFQKLNILFQDATGGSVHIEKRGKKVTMEVMPEELKKSYAYSLFDHNKYEKMCLPVPIGMSAKGLMIRDLVDYPHLLVAGETNYGKSNELHVIANSILLYRQETQLIIIDPKSTEFDYLKGMALVIDEMNQVKSLFESLNRIMDERKKTLKSASCAKIKKYHERGYKMPYIVLIIDEWADLPEDAQDSLWRILRMGRFVGIHVIAATQRPSSKVFEKFGDLKAMFLGRVCFVVADVVNSRMILDSDEAAHLPAIKGRAIYKCGLEKLEVQALLLEPDEAIKLYNDRPMIVRSELIKLEQSPKVLPPR